MANQDEIIFEDLHGVPDQHSVEVDLDADKDGIRHLSQETLPDDGGADDDGDDDVRSLSADDGDDGESIEEDDGDDGDEGVDTRQSRNPFQKRLDRERRLKLAERRRATDAERRANEAERQLAEQRRSVSKSELEAIKTQIGNVETQLEQAFEAGDSKKQVALTRELAKLEAKQMHAESAPPPALPPQQQADSPTLAQKWMQKNRSWYNRAGFERYSKGANEIDSQLFDDGYDVNDPKYYRELDKRMRRRFPEFFDADGREGSRRHGKRSTVAGVDGVENGNRRRALGGRIELGPEDLGVMRSFGLDPKNPTHLKEFAASRRERLMQEEAEGRGR